MKRVWLLFITAMALAQAPAPVAPLHFDAASVKAVQPGSSGPGLRAPSQTIAEPGRLKAQAVSIGALIGYAYGVPPVQIAGMKSRPDLYDIEGKADGPYSRAELCVMLQGLLAERFEPKFHRENARDAGVQAWWWTVRA